MKKISIALSIILTLCLISACGTSDISKTKLEDNNQFMTYIDNSFLDKAISSCCNESNKTRNDIEDIFALLVYAQTEDKTPVTRSISIMFEGEEYYYVYSESYMLDGVVGNELNTTIYEDDFGVSNTYRRILSGEKIEYFNFEKKGECYISHESDMVDVLFEIALD